MRSIEYRPAGQTNDNANVVAPRNPHVLGDAVDAAITAYAVARGDVEDAGAELRRVSGSQTEAAAKREDNDAVKAAIAAGKPPKQMITAAQDRRAVAEATAKVNLEAAQRTANQAYVHATKALAAELESGAMWPRAVAEMDDANADLLAAVDAVRAAYQRVVSATDDAKRVWDGATTEWRGSFRGLPNDPQRVKLGLDDLREVALTDISHLPNPWLTHE